MSSTFKAAVRRSRSIAVKIMRHRGRDPDPGYNLTEKEIAEAPVHVPGTDYVADVPSSNPYDTSVKVPEDQKTPDMVFETYEGPSAQEELQEVKTGVAKAGKSDNLVATSLGPSAFRLQPTVTRMHARERVEYGGAMGGQLRPESAQAIGFQRLFERVREQKGGGKQAETRLVTPEGTRVISSPRQQPGETYQEELLQATGFAGTPVSGGKITPIDLTPTTEAKPVSGVIAQPPPDPGQPLRGQKVLEELFLKERRLPIPYTNKYIAMNLGKPFLLPPDTKVDVLGVKAPYYPLLGTSIGLQIGLGTATAGSASTLTGKAADIFAIQAGGVVQQTADPIIYEAIGGDPKAKGWTSKGAVATIGSFALGLGTTGGIMKASRVAGRVTLPKQQQISVDYGASIKTYEGKLTTSVSKIGGRKVGVTPYTSKTVYKGPVGAGSRLPTTPSSGRVIYRSKLYGDKVKPIRGEVTTFIRDEKVVAPNVRFKVGGKTVKVGRYEASLFDEPMKTGTGTGTRALSKRTLVSMKEPAVMVRDVTGVGKGGLGKPVPSRVVYGFGKVNGKASRTFTAITSKELKPVVIGSKPLDTRIFIGKTQGMSQTGKNVVGLRSSFIEKVTSGDVSKKMAIGGFKPPKTDSVVKIPSAGVLQSQAIKTSSSKATQKAINTQLGIAALKTRPADVGLRGIAGVTSMYKMSSRTPSKTMGGLIQQQVGRTKPYQRVFTPQKIDLIRPISGVRGRQPPIVIPKPSQKPKMTPGVKTVEFTLPKPVRIPKRDIKPSSKIITDVTPAVITRPKTSTKTSKFMDSFSDTATRPNIPVFKPTTPKWKFPPGFFGTSMRGGGLGTRGKSRRFTGFWAPSRVAKASTIGEFALGLDFGKKKKKKKRRRKK